MASASPASGTVRSFTPAWMNGNMIDEKSPSTLSTSAPSGTAAATTEAKTEVATPWATRSGCTPTSDAYEARVRSITGSYP
jgi:hypothetical protein